MHSIRSLKAEDWEEFHKMDVEIFPDDEMKEESFMKRVDSDGSFVLVLDGQIIGNLMVTRFGKDEAYLGRIGVLEAYRGEGFGSLLMDYALDWFNKEGGIRTVHLQADLNEAALGLYKKYGFRKVGTTCHFFVPYDSVESWQKYTCQEIQEDEIELVGKQFPSLPAEMTRRFLASNDYHVLTLKNTTGNIKGVCRFTPSFPGCFPFEITDVDCFDDFVEGIKKYSLPEFDYCRVTFTNIPDLAELCEKREYRLHHRLYKMSLHLQ